MSEVQLKEVMEVWVELLIIWRKMSSIYKNVENLKHKGISKP